jgi:hypothetical protein
VRGAVDFVVGLVLKRLLGRPEPQRRRSSPRAGPAQRRSGDGAPGTRTPKPAPGGSPAPSPGRPRGGLVVLMLGALAVGLVLMLLFEAWYTRLVGVLALFTFVVSGVFAITGSGLLDGDGMS